MDLLSIAAAAFGKGMAAEWLYRKKQRSLAQLPGQGSGNGQPTSERRSLPKPHGGDIKQIGYRGG
jgi:hypothetical protein